MGIARYPSRGRGGSGGGGGRGGFGPSLPAALIRDLEGGSRNDTGRPRGGRGGGRGGQSFGGVRKGPPMSRKDQRKADRRDKKAHHQTGSKSQTPVRTRQDVQRSQPSLSNARLTGIGLPHRHNSLGEKKRHAPAVPAKPTSSKRTKFEELLPGASSVAAGGRAVNSAAAYLADLRYAREAEKKLGIKKGGSLKGPVDGLSALLSGLSSASGTLLPGYLSKEHADQARSLLAGKTGKAKGGASDENVDAVDVESDHDDELGLGVLAGGRSESESESEEYDVGDDDDEEGERDDDDDSSEGDEGMKGFMNGDDDSEGNLMSDDDSEGNLMSDEVSDGEEEEEEGEADGLSSDDLLVSSDGDDELQHLSDDDSSSSDGDGDGDGYGHKNVSDPQLGNGTAAEPGPTSSVQRYMPPALRAAAATGSGQDGAGIERRVTGLLNRLAEANIAGIAKDLLGLYSVNRRQVVNIIITQLVQAAVHGPRATPAFATTAAALVAGLAGSAGAAELAAGFLERTAQQLETAADGLSAQNLVQLLSSCHAVGILSTDLLYGLLYRLVGRFTERDVELMVSVLNSRGLSLRSADPAAMKEFVLAVSSKVAALSAEGGPGASQGLSTRARLMLELVIDIKNNRTTKAGGGAVKGGNKGSGKAGGTAVTISSTLSAWLRTCDVDKVAVRNISWDKVLMPDKKGMWWLPEAGDALAGGRSGGVLPGAGAHLLAAAASEGGADGAAEAAQLLKLAAAQRMNTDVRRAVFVAIMGAADVVHAHERVLRLPLKGDQAREVVRVVVDCCMHEAVYNPFYALLIVRLATHSKAHRLTTQFCIWDQYKVLADLDTAPLTHLARLNATLVVKETLSMTALKAADLGATMEPKHLFFWRLFFQHLLASCKNIEQVATLFSRVSGGVLSSAAAKVELSGLRQRLLLFLRTHLGPWLAANDRSVCVGKVSMDELLVRLQAAEDNLGKPGLMG